MLRTAVLAAVLLGVGSGVASAKDWNDHGNNGSRHERADGRQDNRDDRRWNDSRRDRGHYSNQRGWNSRHYRAPQRYVPAPRYYGYGSDRRRNGWREPYGRGYRYWDNNRYYYAEPGRPAVELSFVLPLR